MKTAAAIVTDRGGRTCHAAIVARELGVPAVVGTGNATAKLKTGQTLTVSCAEGDIGRVYEGSLPFEVAKVTDRRRPGAEDARDAQSRQPGAGLRRRDAAATRASGWRGMEFIINEHIGVHPMALAHPEASHRPTRSAPRSSG